MGYVNPNSVVAVGSILPSLATIAVALRFYARRRRDAMIGADDLLVFFALILTIGLGIMLIIGSALGSLGQPTPSGNGATSYFFATDAALTLTEKLEWSFNLVQILALGAVKLSVIYFYRRIFLGKMFDLVSNIMIGVVVAWTLGFFIATLFLCGTNFWAIWGSLENLLLNCVDTTKVTISFSVTDVVTDILILAMPLRPIWILQMSKHQKIAVYFAFLIGAITIAAGAARLGIYSAQTIGAYQSSNGIDILTTQQFWSMIEIGSSIVAACAPTLRTLFKDLSPIATFKTLSRRSQSTLPSPSSSEDGGSTDMTPTHERAFTPTHRGAYSRSSETHETWLGIHASRESTHEEASGDPTDAAAQNSFIRGSMV